MRALSIVSIVTAILFSFMTFAQAAVVSKGNLKGKAVKWTQGSVSVEKKGTSYTIKLGGNFKTKKGPALFVYLGNGSPTKKIGKLKAISGAQTYKVPASVDPSKYSTLYIYCVPFNAVFGSARLK